MDKDNKPFESGYSEGYAKSLEGKIAGKKKGAIPNLRLTSEMMNSIKLISHSSGELIIGYDKGDKQLNAKVEGNRLGTYGQKNPIEGKARDFLGITEEDLGSIEDEFPTARKQREKLLSKIERVRQAAARSGAFAQRNIFLEDVNGNS